MRGKKNNDDFDRLDNLLCVGWPLLSVDFLNLKARYSTIAFVVVRPRSMRQKC